MLRAHLVLLGAGFLVSSLLSPAALASPPGGDDADAPPAVSRDAEQRALVEVQRLVASGADLDAAIEGRETLLGHPAYGVTRLHDAAASGHADVVRYLLEHGADPRAVAGTKSHLNELTPIEVARETGGEQIAKLLESYRVFRLWYEPGDREPVRLSLDTGQIISDWLEEPRPEPDLAILPAVPDVRAAPGAAVVSASGTPYGRLSAVPSGAAWTQQLARADTQAGRAFLVRSRSGRVFKGLIARIDTESQLIVLSFTDLVRTSGESGAAHAVVEAFNKAMQEGRVAAFTDLCTAAMARSLRGAAPVPAPEVRRVERAAARGDSATIVLFEQQPADAGGAETLVTFELRHIGPKWRIKSRTVRPATAPPRETPVDTGNGEEDEL